MSMLPMSADPQRPKLLILPHVSVIGGAGLYNRAVIKTLTDQADVTLIGTAASSYADLDCPIADAPAPPRPIIPAYSGASLSSFLFHLALAPFRAISSFLWIRRHRKLLSTYDAIITTSSIDLPLLGILRFARPSLKRVCIVQENAFLDGVRGALNRVLLGRVNTAVSISRSWSNRAAASQIATILTLNPFDPPAIPPSTNDDDADFDIIFLGGGSRIKGAALVFALVEQIAATRPIRVALLGNLSPPQTEDVLALQARLKNQGSVIELLGFVSNTASFLRRARLLLLPITDPHFCRPAVEAGLCGRAFVVSHLPGLEDFAEPGGNCLSAPPGDVAAWHDVCLRLLQDHVERRRLAAGNMALSQSRFSLQTFKDKCREIVDACR